MLGIQCYAIFWLLVSGYAFQIMMAHTGSMADDEERQILKDEMESMGKFMSAQSIGKTFLVMSVVLLLIDIMGFVLTYQYAELRPWQLVAFYLVAAALLIDSLVDFVRMRKLMRAKEPDEVAACMSQYVEGASSWNGVALIAVGGKCLLAVVLVLWTVFR
jgi:hypothetical protein